MTGTLSWLIWLCRALTSPLCCSAVARAFVSRTAAASAAACLLATAKSRSFVSAVICSHGTQSFQQSADNEPVAGALICSLLSALYCTL